MSHELPSSSLLSDRAVMLRRVRSFFADRGVMEVDVAALAPTGAIDTHIDLIACKGHYLHSSPEYGMKRLLSMGLPDIYQLSHVFREGECGERHLPEFMMAEWYRLDVPLETLIEETCAFVELFVDSKPHNTLTYRQALQEHAGVDYQEASLERLQEALAIDNPPSDRDTLLQLLFAYRVEPKLSPEIITIIRDYPSTQAALAQTALRDGELIAERFEIFYGGFELANGYHELRDPLEHRRRFEQANAKRQSLGKPTYPIDELFLSALEKGLPDCCGVAVGFDRLMMARHNLSHIQEVTPWMHPEQKLLAGKVKCIP